METTRNETDHPVTVPHAEAPLTTGHPVSGSIRESVRRHGVSRTWHYEELKQGRIRGWKIGRRTIVDFDSVRSRIAQYPEYGK